MSHGRLNESFPPGWARLSDPRVSLGCNALGDLAEYSRVQSAGLQAGRVGPVRFLLEGGAFGPLLV